MKRNSTQLARQSYDLLVVGGGIHGACIAWDATLRGLSVALIEKGDFGHATSSNSLKTVHGGLRYLQDADFKLVRKMIHERRTLMRIAPHLVHPLPCLMPTTGRLLKSKAAMTVALAMNDLVGFDRNQIGDPEKYLPGGRVISRAECLRLLPGIADQGITGGAIWYDGQMYNSERLILSFVHSAVHLGAHAANYVEAVAFLVDGRRITGIRAKDTLTGDELEIRAKLVVNTAGPWVDRLLETLNGHRRQPDRKFRLSTAMNIVTRQIVPDYAVGLPSRYLPKGSTTEKSRLLFMAPWRDYSIIGTIHTHYNGRLDAYQVTEQDVQDFVDEINRAYPGATLSMHDVYFVHQGFLPAANNGTGSDKVKLVRQGQIYDHQQEDTIEGLVTVVGVKYTSSREVAQQAVDLVFKKLGRVSPPCLTAEFPLYGGQIERFNDFLAHAIAQRPHSVEAATIRHLIYTYGSEYPRLLRYLQTDPQWGQTVCDSAAVLKAEVLHGVRYEMAQKLSDVVLRRTELGSAGKPDTPCLHTCAHIMAAELGWDAPRTTREIDEVHAVYNIVA